MATQFITAKLLSINRDKLHKQKLIKQILLSLHGFPKPQALLVLALSRSTTLIKAAMMAK